MNKEQIHSFRKQIDACIKEAENDLSSGESGRPEYKREMELTRMNLQQAKMWAGKCLEAFKENDFPENLKDEANINE